jgi:small GTP-binding protein
MDKLEKKQLLNKIEQKVKEIRTYTPNVAIFGDSGVGKSSLCNALFGKDVAAISDVEACTREPQEIFIGNEKDGGINLIDVPGIGEDPKRHKEYKELYKSLLPKLDLILWAIKADDRKYASALEVYSELLIPNLKNCPVVFVITQVDKIEPHREWDIKKNKPSDAQEVNLLKKQEDISLRFGISKDLIVPVSSADTYNLPALIDKIVEVLPNEKKSSIVREAKEENTSEETYIKAEKGIWDSVLDTFGEAYDSAKEFLSDISDIIKENAKEVVKEGAKVAALAAVSLIKGWFSKDSK